MEILEGGGYDKHPPEIPGGGGGVLKQDSVLHEKYEHFLELHISKH